MSARADFQVFTFNEHLGDNQSEINTGFTFMGEFSSTKIFEINQELFACDCPLERAGSLMKFA